MVNSGISRGARRLIHTNFGGAPRTKQESLVQLSGHCVYANKSVAKLTRQLLYGAKKQKKKQSKNKGKKYRNSHIATVFSLRCIRTKPRYCPFCETATDILFQTPNEVAGLCVVDHHWFSCNSNSYGASDWRVSRLLCQTTKSSHHASNTGTNDDRPNKFLLLRWGPRARYRSLFLRRTMPGFSSDAAQATVMWPSRVSVHLVQRVSTNRAGASARKTERNNVYTPSLCDLSATAFFVLNTWMNFVGLF